jgi:hypothetical protein
VALIPWLLRGEGTGMTKATGRTRQERHLKRIDRAQELPVEAPVEREA